MTAADTRQLLVKAIHSTIQQLERESEVSPDDPALLTLKGRLVRRMAEIDGPMDPPFEADPEIIK